MFNLGGAPDTPAPPVNVPGEGQLMARLCTTLGDLGVLLAEKEAPRTVANFVALAVGGVEWTDTMGRRRKDSLYAGTTFHRVIPEFMVQGGDPAGKGTGGPGYKWKDEAAALKLKHDRPGVLSMANAGPNTNGSQFFITEIPTPWLDGKHAVFGHVVSGLDLVQRITRVPRNQQDRPVEPIKLKAVEIYRV